jgi:PTH1 family peptidyl-tRNA hydrolase
MKVVFAQGNPGTKYTTTRHNTGFLVLEKFADDRAAKWSANIKFKAEIATLDINNEKILLVKPTTFYNETGLSARSIIDFYKLDPIKDFLVIHDDLALPFGTIRIRQRGSDAGNNGIKSINAHIGENYNRIRIGILNDLRSTTGDTDFVLDNFTKSESEQFETEITTQATNLINEFINGSLSIKSIKKTN